MPGARGNAMMRSALGLLVGFLVSASIFWFGNQAYQQYVIAPSGADATRPDRYGEFLASNVTAALAGAPLIWCLIALVGGGAAALISRKRWAAWVFGAVALALGAANMMLIPLPWWAWAAGLLGVGVGALVATRLAPAA